MTNTTLPSDVANGMRELLDDESIETLGDFIAAVRDAADGGSVSVDDLCHTSAETPHVASTDDKTYRFLCFYDGVALAHLADEPVTIQTESPAGEPIEARATPDGTVSVTPAGAVMSFGIAADVEPPAGDDPVSEAIYRAVCPYVRAFPTREAYERWTERTSSATVGMPLESGVPIAAALAE